MFKWINKKIIRMPLYISSLYISSLYILGCSNSVELSNQCLKQRYSQSFAESNFYQGWKIIENQGKEKGCSSALTYFENGVEQGEYFELSTLYYDYCVGTVGSLNYYTSSSIYNGGDRSGGPVADEFRWIDEMAKCNRPVESFAAGQMYLNGYKVDKDYDSALYLMTIGAKSGYGHAQMQLALALFEIGEHDNAILWLEKAVDSGYPGAIEFLETMNLIY